MSAGRFQPSGLSKIFATDAGTLSDCKSSDNSVGFGLQFAAVAGRTYEVAMEKGIGREAPNDCFPDLV